MSFLILGTGTAVPRHFIAQTDAVEVAKEFCCKTKEDARLLSALYSRTGVEHRGSVLLEKPEGMDQRQSFFPPLSGEADRGPATQQRMKLYRKEAIPLALSAARQALEASQLSSEHIQHLITVSCTGFCAPGIDIALIKKMQLSSDIHRTHIGFMGCHGLFNGWRVASAWTKAYPESHLLLCAVELCSIHFQYQLDPDQMVANALFADGAAALVVGSPREKKTSSWEMFASGSFLFPDSEETMTWRIGDHGFEMTLSPKVPRLIGNHLRPWLERWLQGHRLKLEQVHSWAVHPGGPRILSAVSASLGLSEKSLQVSRDVLASHGNMSSPTILFIVDRLMKTDAPRPCVALGFGPGLVVEAALFL